MLFQIIEPHFSLISKNINYDNLSSPPSFPSFTIISPAIHLLFFRIPGAVFETVLPRSGCIPAKKEKRRRRHGIAVGPRSRSHNPSCDVRGAVPNVVTFVIFPPGAPEALFPQGNPRERYQTQTRRGCAPLLARVLVPRVAGDRWGTLSSARNQLRLDELCVSRNASRSYRPINNKPRTTLHVALARREVPRATTEPRRSVKLICIGPAQDRAHNTCLKLHPGTCTWFLYFCWRVVDAVVSADHRYYAWFFSCRV